MEAEHFLIDWERIDTELERSGKAGSFSTRLLKESAIDIFAGVNMPNYQRMIYILLDADFAAGIQPPSSTIGLDAFIKPDLAGRENLYNFGVMLKDDRFKEEFNLFAEELLQHIKDLSSSTEAVNAFRGLISRWQLFMSRNSPLITAEEYQGLWGELIFMEKILLPRAGTDAVSAWKGPLGSPQDFSHRGVYHEVKTTTMGKFGTVRISNEYQLETPNDAPLFLSVIHITESNTGDSLPNIVSRIRGMLKDDPSSWETFDDRLKRAGYDNDRADQFDRTKYDLKSIQNYKVDDGFPCLKSRDLKVGISQVSYLIRLREIEGYLLPWDHNTIE